MTTDWNPVLRGELTKPYWGELQAFVRSRLAAFKVPHRIVFVTEIPKGPTGKMQRIGMAQRLGIAS